MKKVNIELVDLPYSVEEALNRLRINIKFSGHSTKKILVTSSVPNEGKSFISVYLWKMLAEAGFKTAFIDLDLRKATATNRYKVKTDEEVKGMDYYLSGIANYEDVVYSTNIENGYFVPCTNVLENPTVLLEDPKFKELLDKLSNEFRYVIIDSPPLDNVADGALIASMCDGAVMVVRSGYVSKKIIKQAVDQLDRVGCKLLGTVLNRVPNSKKKYGKYYSYGYGGYGYGKTKKEEKAESEDNK